MEKVECAKPTSSALQRSQHEKHINDCTITSIFMYISTYNYVYTCTNVNSLCTPCLLEPSNNVVAEEHEAIHRLVCTFAKKNPFQYGRQRVFSPFKIEQILVFERRIHRQKAAVFLVLVSQLRVLVQVAETSSPLRESSREQQGEKERLSLYTDSKI